MRGPTGAVAPRGQRGNGQRQRRRPLQNTNGSGGAGRYMKGGAAKRAAATERGRRRCRRPLQKEGGGDVGGRYRKRAAGTSPPISPPFLPQGIGAVVTGTMPWGRMPQQLHFAIVLVPCQPPCFKWDHRGILPVAVAVAVKVVEYPDGPDRVKWRAPECCKC
jgi:hypothetical protein